MSLNLLKRITNHVCNVTEASEEMVLASALAAVSFACQRLITVAPVPGRPMRCPLHFMGIAISGDGKSEADKYLMAAARRFEQQRKRNFAKELAQYEISEKVYTATVKALAKAVAKEAEREFNAVDDEDECTASQQRERLEIAQSALEDQRPKKPVEFRSIYENVTPAMMSKGLMRNPSASILSHEGANTLRSGIFSDPGLLNSGYDGSAYAFDRISHGSHSVPSILITLFVLMQPGPFTNLVKTKGDYLKSVGLFNRIFFFRPPTVIGSRTFNKKGDPDAQREFDERMAECMELSYPSPDDPEPEVIEITLDRYAQSKWDRYREDAEAASKPTMAGGDPDTYLARTPQNVARLAANLTFFFEKKNVVGSEVMEFAISQVEQYTQNYRDIFFPPAAPQAEIDAKEMYEWLEGCLREDPRMTKIAIADIQNRGPHRLRKAHMCRPALAFLAQYNYLWFAWGYREDTQFTKRRKPTEFVCFASRNLQNPAQPQASQLVDVSWSTYLNAFPPVFPAGAFPEAGKKWVSRNKLSNSGFHNI